MAMLFAALAAGCTGDSGRNPILGGDGIAVLPPTVIAIAPIDNATGVALANPIITATFSEPMAPISGGATFTVTSASPNLPATGTVALDTTKRIATFTLSTGTTLAPINLYTATLTGAKSLTTGLALASPKVWRFTTGPLPDSIRPRVTLTVPATRIPGTVGVPTNTSIAADFTEDMASSTLTTPGTFTVTGPNGVAVEGGVTYDSKTALFTPAFGLAADTTYTATISTAATDLAGNGLAGNQAPLPAASGYVWTFKTGPAPDTIRPRVTLTNPATRVPPTIAVPINTAISAAFTEDMAPATLTMPGTFTVTGPGAASVAGNVAYASRTAVFTPASALASNTTYTATITPAATDLAGNQLAGNQAPLPAASSYVWTFITGLAADATRPRVTVTVPATTVPPMTGVYLNTAITAAFTKDMAPTTLNGASFTLTGPGLFPVAGGVTYASRTAKFTPTAALLADTTYTATVAKTATDLTGNQLAGNQASLPDASDYIWTFKTGASSDTTRPRVTITVPVTTIPGPTSGVNSNTAITAAFTEDMDPSTITSASFLVVANPPGVAPLGNVTYSAGSRTAIFTPSAGLAASTTYVATITVAATDLAGNQLAGNQAPLPAPSNYMWSFTTAITDTIAPTILFTSPADGATNVAINTAVNATFSEAMNPSTINAATFTLQASGPPTGPALNGAVTYDLATNIATLTLSGPLALSTTYKATITGANDLSGNALASGSVPNPWTFTTGSGSVPGGVPLGSAGAFGIMATSAITNTGFSIINGDVSLDPGTSFTGYPPLVLNGTFHNNDAVSHQARADLLAAYAFAKGLPPGTTISGGADLGALYPLGMPPGTYTSGSTMLVSTPLTLDAGGNANAIWVFQIGSSLTTTANVSLLNGAQAKNVYWVPTSDVTVGVGTTFNGTIVTGRDATGKTGSIINGRILAGAILPGTIALDTNTVNVPAP